MIVDETDGIWQVRNSKKKKYIYIQNKEKFNYVVFWNVMPSVGWFRTDVSVFLDILTLEDWTDT
jgi:hypothetical protein